MPPSDSLLHPGTLPSLPVLPERARQGSGAARRSIHRRSALISATMLTKNSAAYLDDALTALTWCDEVIVLDTGSTDDTAEIATRHNNVRFNRLEGEFPGFGRAHRHAVSLARNDWILSIDSDEVVSLALALEIAGRHLDPDTVYELPFHNYFNGRRITTCGWAPDRHERLFHRRRTNFCESAVHERVGTSGLSVQPLRGAVLHYSYNSLDDFLRKMRAYSTLFARQNYGRRESGPVRAVARSTWAFFKSYFLQRGCLQGTEGLVISAYKAQVVFWKYLSLHEANRRASA